MTYGFYCAIWFHMWTYIARHDFFFTYFISIWLDNSSNNKIMISYVDIWVHIAQYGSICRHIIFILHNMILYVDIWIHIAQYSFICRHMLHTAQYGLYDDIWVYNVQYCFICRYMLPIALYESICRHVESCSVGRTICHHMEPYCAIWLNM